MQTVGAKIGSYLHIVTCSFVDVDEAQSLLVANYSWGIEDAPSLRQTFRLQDYLTEEFRRAGRAGDTVVIHDTQSDPRTDAPAYAALAIGAFVTVPFHRDGQWTAYLAITNTTPRDWRADEVWLIQELSNRIFPRIERARAERALHERQSQVEMLNARLQRAMQETHHRIKNNLQVIAALVEMQSYGLAPRGENAMRRINIHVRALAAIHDLLTQQAREDSEQTDLDAQAVLDRLIPMLQGVTDGRHIRYEAEAVPVPVSRSAALALLVNELVSNAVKHAVGEIEITLKLSEQYAPGRERRARRRARLEVCDDGPGFPDGFDPVQAANTGLELVDSAARWDLQGKVSYENRTEGGARVVVTFPISGAEAS